MFDLLVGCTLHLSCLAGFDWIRSGFGGKKSCDWNKVEDIDRPSACHVYRDFDWKHPAAKSAVMTHMYAWAVLIALQVWPLCWSAPLNVVKPAFLSAALSNIMKMPRVPLTPSSTQLSGHASNRCPDNPAGDLDLNRPRFSPKDSLLDGYVNSPGELLIKIALPSCTYEI